MSLLLVSASSVAQNTALEKPLLRRPQPELRWVRTVEGWECTDQWADLRVISRRYEPPLHPSVVAAGQLMLSLVSLLLLPSGRR